MKIRNITRTITFTTVSAFVYDFEHREKGPHYNDFVIPGDFSKLSEKEVLSEIRDAFETKTLSIMTVEVKKVEKKKRIMTEIDFIRNSRDATPEDVEETEEGE